jgi:uncharacterized repeat protein (TIGR01451 family)
MNKLASALLMAALSGSVAYAAEVTVRNDSLQDFGNAVVVAGFVEGEQAASWLTSPCAGNIRGLQVFWRSPSGTSGNTIHAAIEVSRAGSFPTPGALALRVVGPVLTDNALNEYRYLDENQTVPISVAVTANELFVVALVFDRPNGSGDPSVVRDVDGNQNGRNSLRARIGPGNYQWFNSATLGVTGDWVIRAVVDCDASAQQADVGVGGQSTPSQYTAGQALSYTLVVDNAGPAAAPATTVVDIFPSSFTSPTWTCSASGGATCVASGSGNITQNVSLPAGSSVTFVANGVVAPGTTGDISNSLTAVVGGSVSDPQQGNNSTTILTSPAAGPEVFANGFEP